MARYDLRNRRAVVEFGPHSPFSAVANLGDGLAEADKSGRVVQFLRFNDRSEWQRGREVGLVLFLEPDEVHDPWEVHFIGRLPPVGSVFEQGGISDFVGINGVDFVSPGLNRGLAFGDDFTLQNSRFDDPVEQSTRGIQPPHGKGRDEDFVIRVCVDALAPKHVMGLVLICLA